MSFWLDGPRDDPRANTKAEEMLLSKLTDGQRKCYLEHRFFYVRSAENRIYILWNGNQAIARRGPHCESWRVYEAFPHDHRSYRQLPKADRLLAQMLMLQTNPRLFHNIACSMHYYMHDSSFHTLFTDKSLLDTIEPAKPRGGLARRFLEAKLF